MQRTQQLRPLALSLLTGALLWLPGCDNPACVFGGSCFQEPGSGALGTVAASVPANDEWVSVNAPQIERVAPTGSATVDSRTPLVIVFSESMSNSGMATAFLLQDSTGAPAAYVTSLVGNGRVLVLLTLNELQADEPFTLNFAPNAHLQDRNGQALSIPEDRQVMSFTVAPTNANIPKLVTSWPGDNTTYQNGRGEVLAFFDRAIDPTTLDATSFHVQVNGVDLATPIDPQVLSLAGGLGTDARVVRWKNVDAQGDTLALGLDVPVAIELSPVGHLIRDEAANAVAHTLFDYRTAPFGAPTAAAITSEPTDAIGIDSISGPENLAVQVTLDGAQAGDHLGIFVIGTEPNVLQNPKLICLGRDVALVAPFTDFTLTAAELNLRASSSPVTARFAEGELHFAFQLRRGDKQSPITLLDTDATQAGEQAPILDTTLPTLTGLSTSGTVTATYSSDMRDLVVVGRASEVLRAALVTSSLGDNSGGSAEPPSVAGSSPTGLFICRPVPLGLVDPAQLPLAFQLTLYDRALNHIGPLNSSFQQRGTVGPGNASFTEIAVRVFDANTGAPLFEAGVHTHEYDSITDSVFSVADFVTDANGYVLMPSSLFGGRNILTVEATGYEFFTFDGVTVDRVDVPLHPLLDAGATVEGLVSSSAPQIALYTSLVADSRLDDPGQVFEPVTNCTYDPTAALFTCPYDPYAILSRRIGAQSAFAILPVPSILLYTAAAFLKAATLELPLSPVAPGAALVNDQAHRHMLDDAGLDPEEAAIDAPPQLLATTAYPGLVGEPVVSVEATSPGMPGTVVVGVGKAFSDGLPPGTFAVRAAYPGSVDGIVDDVDDQLGSYVTQGTLDADLLLRMQLRDAAGNIGGVRPRFSTNPVASDPPAASDLGLFPMEPDLGGLANKLSFIDVLPDSAAQPGLYRVVLTDINGARWVIWTPDPPDSADPEVHTYLPLIGPGLTFPLAPGDLDCRISMFAWPTFDPANFLWSDVEREFDLFSHSTLLIVTPP